MKVVRHTVVRLALVVSVASAGCTFRPYLRDSRDPALSTAAPCYAGDICAVAYDGLGLAWTTEAMQTARH